MTQIDRRFVVGALLATAASGPAFGARCRIARASLDAGWWPRPGLPARIQEIYPTVLDGRIFVAGGLEARDGPDVDAISDQLFVMRRQTEVAIGDTEAIRIACDFDWESRAPLPEPRHHPNLVGHDGFVYAIGGFRAGNGGIWEMIPNTTRYELGSDEWVEMAPMPVPYAETCAVSLGGLIHVATGRQPDAAANANWPDHGDRGDHLAYDASRDSWTRRAPNPNPRNSAAGAVLNGQFHIVGGRRVGGGNSDQHEAYDPVADTWQSRAPLPQAQGGLAAAVSGGKLVAFGGEYFDNGGGVYPQVWIYDPELDHWQAGPDMPTPRHGLGGVSLGDEIYAIGGASSASGRNTTNLVQRLRLAE
ncbi:kelch repeat-containing protein [Maricaulis sp.]|uniref:Kelch repeat-containing protein n=1 Tax=Maricaulis sp. TaxID=1486257 RepID=UPI002B273731|nr:kelch repeat-containing protein [Maricaulis sp.]